MSEERDECERFVALARVALKADQDFDEVAAVCSCTDPMVNPEPDCWFVILSDERHRRRVEYVAEAMRLESARLSARAAGGAA